MEYLGAWRTLIHEKNLKSKISCQAPFKSVMANVVNDWFQPFPSRAAASALPPRASSRARCQSLRIPGHPFCPPFCFCVRHFDSVSAILFLCPPFCFCVRQFVSVSAILVLCPPFCFCVRHFVSVSAILFLCTPFCFLGHHGVSHFSLCPPFCFCVCHFVSAILLSGFPFWRVRLQMFLSCSY